MSEDDAVLLLVRVRLERWENVSPVRSAIRAIGGEPYWHRLNGPVLLYYFYIDTSAAEAKEALEKRIGRRLSMRTLRGYDELEILKHPPEGWHDEEEE